LSGRTYAAYTDGASRGNPGESGIGIKVYDESGNTILTISDYIGVATNNVAEYTALLALLKEAKSMSCSRLVVHSDSELMVRQVNRMYKVKDEGLKKLFAKVVDAQATLPMELELRYIPREKNREADLLANQGIDEKRRTTK